MNNIILQVVENNFSKNKFFGKLINGSWEMIIRVRFLIGLGPPLPNFFTGGEMALLLKNSSKGVVAFVKGYKLS